jgi:aspartate kinase
MISTSEVKVSCTIDVQDCDRAIASLCQTFEIATSPVQLPSRREALSHYPPVRGVALDRNQARLSVRRVPDQPGMAAKIFGVLAKENISVDTIIQSQRCRIFKGTPTRDLACTIVQADAETARLALQDLASLWGWGEVTVDTNIAKVSIVGAGMVGHPGVAAEMFAALARHQINIQMITTSEIKISCVVAETEGVTALKVIPRCFPSGGQRAGGVTRLKSAWEHRQAFACRGEVSSPWFPRPGFLALVSSPWFPSPQIDLNLRQSLSG